MGQCVDDRLVMVQALGTGLNNRQDRAGHIFAIALRYCIIRGALK